MSPCLLFDREPSLTIKTNSYHFCKLSLVKKPNVSARLVEEPDHQHDKEATETIDANILYDGGKLREDPTPAGCSITSFIKGKRKNK